MEKRTQSRGIVLITTLCILTFLVMLSTMLVTTGYNTMKRAGSFSESEQAHQAAMAGIAYAQMRAEADMAWMTYDSGTRTWKTAAGGSFSGITVTETASNGVVVGDLRASSGTRSRFIISFNPASTATAYTSCNNMAFDTADETFFKGVHFRDVPAHNVSLIVEGQVVSPDGVWVRASRLAEISLARDLKTMVDAVAYSGKDMKISVDTTGGNWSVGSTDDSGSTEVGLRPMGDINLYSPDYPSTSTYDFGATTVHFTDNAGGTQNGARLLDFNNPNSVGLTYTPATSDHVDRQSSASKMAQVAVKPSDLYNSTYPATITEGTYIVQSDGTLSYYPFSYDPSKTIVYNGKVSGKYKVTYDGVSYNDATLPSEANTFFKGSGGDWSLTITQPTKVVTSTGTDATMNFSVLSASPTTNVVTAQFTPPAKSTKPALLQTTTSDILVAGDVTGTGSVISGGNLTMEGHSILKPSSNSGLTLYAGKDFNLQPISGNTRLSVSTADVENATKAVLMTLAGTTNQSSVAVKDFTKAAQSLEDQLLVVADPTYTDKPTDFGSWTRTHPNGTMGDYIKATLNLSSDKDVEAFASNVMQNYSTRSGGTNTVSTTFNSAKTPSDHDEVLYGMVYACGDFKANPGTGNNLTVQGAVVAYGNDPSKTFSASDQSTWAGANGKGTIQMSGKSVNFTYDPAYLGALSRLFSASYVRTKRNFFFNY